MHPVVRRRALVCLLLSFACGSLLLAQEWQSIGRTWTDKNNTENYAAYMISAAYAEHGYWGAKVEIKQSGAKRLFIVDPGQLFHVKEVVINGPEQVQESKNAGDAPKPGDVYSADRMNEWVGRLRKEYAGQDSRLKLVRSGVAYDHAHAQVTIQVTFEERN